MQQNDSQEQDLLENQTQLAAEAATQTTEAVTQAAPSNEEQDSGLNYRDSGIESKILHAIAEMGFEQMTPIQAQAIPAMLSGKDIIGQAQTGTGKTAAFGIPLIQNIDPDDHSLQAIILCPTRELAIQAAEEIRHYAKYMPGIKVLPIYGGQDITKQIRSLKTEVQIVVGTPGRVMDHMRRHTLKLNNIRTVVLDEADEMLNMGFREDIELILSEMPEARQTALFSATMPKAILDITKMYQKPDAVLIQMVKKELTIPLIKQYYYEVPSKSKDEVVCRLLDYYNPKRSLIFCNTKRMVDELSENLKGRGYFAEGLHGDLSQNQRDSVMNLFRNGRVDILIATDVAARGIDVDDVEAVFNYDVPQDIEYYVHRIGRTGRAGRKGRAFTLIVGKEIFKIREIEQTCKTKMKARSIPSAADITAVKAEKVLSKAFEVMQGQDLEKMTKIIEEKLNDEDCTAMELAAAFLKIGMGEEIQEIQVEKFVPHSRYGAKGGRGDGRRDSGSGRSYGSSRSGGEGRSYGDRNASGSSRPSGEGRSYSDRNSSGSSRPSGEGRSYADRNASGSSRPSGEGRSYADRNASGSSRPSGEGRSYADRKPSGEGRSYADRNSTGSSRPSGEGRSYADRKPSGEGRSYSDRNSTGSSRPSGEGRSYADRKPSGEGRSYADKKPSGEGRSYADRNSTGDRN